MSSNLKTALTEDPPIVLDANYQFNIADRRYLDDQALAAQTHIVDSLISGIHSTWFALSSSSAAVVAGDCVVSGIDNPNPNGVPIVTKANSSTLGTAGCVAGIVMAAAAPGSRVRVALAGSIVPKAITNLASTQGVARCNITTGRPERIASPSTTDYLVGIINSVGELEVIPLGTFSAYNVGGGGGGPSTVPWVYNEGSNWTNTHTVSAGDGTPANYGVDTSGAGFSMLLPPTPSDAETYGFYDTTGGCSLAKPLTVNGNGHNIMGNSTILLQSAWDSVTVVYNHKATVWVVQ